ncbi:M20/M25/M40 family metallo-hydrolase [Sporolactobacillus shoreae]|uniref:M20/M25/M40 family metallo-hydrolase n=1 Tax=Sporolactobacillus shoreae TaxID=1465501 RepID=A0A4Z0GPC4_9BACL|nr:M20/M25/M40 family metallo-hydrolase [Sporolactobacillus shoreae]TGA98982.1 M20/M25/M40 family metallo-hydrolase [Sporolactobacillus shoreae]
MSKRDEIIERYKKYLADYVKLPSVSAQNRATQETADFLQKLFTEAGGHAEVFSDYEHPLVYADFQPKDAKKNKTTIVFYNHYDVQPPEPLEEWHSEPFTLTETDGKLVGRGVADCKGELIVRLTALSIYKQEHGDFPFRVKFFVEGAEEIASQNLEDYLKKYADLFQTDLVVWEGGSKTSQGKLEITGGNKGISCFDLVARTSKDDIHSSSAAYIEGPGWRLTQALAALRDIESGRILVDGFYDDVEEPSPRARELINKMYLDKDAVRTLHDLNRPFLFDNIKEAYAFEPTINIAGLTSGYEGESVKTVLPHTARAKIDVRLVPHQDPIDIQQKVRKYLDKRGFSDVKLEYLMGEKGYRSDLDTPIVRNVLNIAAEIYGGTDNLQLLPTSSGTGPMYLFNHYLHAPLMSFGIGDPGSGAHSPNENVHLSNYYQGIHFVTAIFEKLAQDLNSSSKSNAVH